MKRIPNRIYLQFHGQPSFELPDTDLEQYNEESEITWCEDMINDTDVEYQRVPRWQVDMRTCGLDFAKAARRAAKDYADGIAQHEERKKYSEEDFLKGAEWMCNFFWGTIKEQAEKKGLI